MFNKYVTYVFILFTYLNVHLNNGLSDESRSKEGPEWNQEMTTGDSSQVKQGIWDLRNIVSIGKHWKIIYWKINVKLTTKYSSILILHPVNKTLTAYSHWICYCKPFTFEICNYEIGKNKDIKIDRHTDSRDTALMALEIYYIFIS